MPNFSGKSYYEILGVAPEAAEEDIRRAYKELARVYHPDSHFFDEILGAKAGPPSENDTFKLITHAYNILTNREQRAAYDRILPRNLAAWDDDRIPAGMGDAPFPDPALIRPARTAAAFGVFGTQSKEELNSAFDEPEQYKAPSNVGFFEALMSFFGRSSGNQK
ncbi:MAG: DnaJ domain-containing protein [Oligoflexia bacterium]|nr:DnaJ domain-containing protein [Oligoflexia bacterium]